MRIARCDARAYCEQATRSIAMVDQVGSRPFMSRSRLCRFAPAPRVLLIQLLNKYIYIDVLSCYQDIKIHNAESLRYRFHFVFSEEQ